MGNEFHEIYDVVVKHPKRVAHLIEEHFSEMTDYEKDKFFKGCHIHNEEQMNKGLKTIVSYTGAHAPFWTHAAFKRVARENGYDCEDKPYTEYDVNFLAQAYAADLRILKMSATESIKAAVELLEDEDAPGDASERAYDMWKQRVDYFD